MSVHALGEALQQKDIPATARLVLIYLADRMNFHAGEMSQKAWPSIRRLSEDTGLSKRSVQRSIRLLEEKGLISIGPLDGGRVEYLWLLSKRKGEYVPMPDEKGGVRTGKGVPQSRPESVTVARGGCHSGTHYKNHKDNHKKNNGADAPIRLWDVAREILGGPLLGKTLKDHDEAKVKDAITKTLLKDPADPKTYLLGVLAEKSGDSAPAWQMSDDALMAAAEEKGVQTKGKTRQDLINAVR